VRITSVELGPPNKHGERVLKYQLKALGSTWFELAVVAPDEVGAVQELAAAVQQAMHTPDDYSLKEASPRTPQFR
jgi:hypothetical protein